MVFTVGQGNEALSGETVRYRSLNGWPWGDAVVAEVAQMLTLVGEAIVITDGSRAFANPAFCDLTGHTPDLVLKDPKVTDFVLPAGRRTLEMPPEEANMIREAHRFRTKMPRADGHQVDVDVETFHASLVPGKTAVFALVRPAAAARDEGAPALMRRAMQFVLEHVELENGQRKELGRSLAKSLGKGDVHYFLANYAAMGLGHVEVASHEGTSLRLRASDTIDRLRGEKSARLVTCDLALGFLEGAVETFAGDGHVLGAETACASRGDDGCTFVIRYQAP